MHLRLPTFLCPLFLFATPVAAAEPADALAAALHGNPQIVLALDFGRAWRGPERESLQQISAVHPIVPSYHLKDLPTQVGIAADAIDRFMVIAVTPGGEIGVRPSFVGILEAVDAKSIDGLIEKYVGADPTVATIAGREVVRNAASGREAHRIDPRTAALGEFGAVGTWLSTHDAELDATWKPFAAVAARRPLLALEVGIPSFLAAAAPGIAASPYGPLVPARRWRIVVEPEAKQLKIALRGEFADAAAATAAVGPLKQALLGLDGYLQMAATGMPDVFIRKPTEYPRGAELNEPLQAAFAAARKAIAAAEPNVEGTAVEATLNIATDKPATTAFLLITLMPRTAKGPGEP